jgi:predicted nucleic acid-binding protein
MPQRIVDACCLINLYATRNVLDILRVVNGGLFVPDIVKEESLFIRREDDQDQTILIPEAIDLTEALDEGLLHECHLENDKEVQQFVQFAAAVDDGEAICLALAKCRNWAVATDDRKAIRLAAAESIATITTAEIVKQWADSCNTTDDIVAETLRRIERYARFSPRRDFPLHDWWECLSSISAH